MWIAGWTILYVNSLASFGFGTLSERSKTAQFGP